MNTTNFEPIMYFATVNSHLTYMRAFASLDEAKNWVENWNEGTFFGATISLDNKFKLTKTERLELPNAVHYEAR